MLLNSEHFVELFSVARGRQEPVEFVTKACYPDDHDELVYVANEEDEFINRMFEQHLGFINRVAALDRFHFTYIPSLVNRLKDGDVLRYADPSMAEGYVPNAVGNDFLLKDLLNADDRKRFKHGIVCIKNRLNYSAFSASGGRVYSFVNLFFPLSSDSEKSLARQLLEILFILRYSAELDDRQRFSCGNPMYSIDDDRMRDDGNIADDHFNSQLDGESIGDLIREIRERVEKLRQRGLAASVLDELLHPEGRLSQMVITKDFRIILPDYHDMEIKMEPLVKAVYLLFLKHPEGIRFKELPGYREELSGIYLKLKPNGLTDRVKRSIEDVTNPLLNSINEKCARIRGAFVGQFDNYLAKYYYIDGRRGEPKKIALARELIVWE